MVLSLCKKVRRNLAGQTFELLKTEQNVESHRYDKKLSRKLSLKITSQAHKVQGKLKVSLPIFSKLLFKIPTQILDQMDGLNLI